MTTPDQPTGMNELRQILEGFRDAINPNVYKIKLLEEAEAAVQQLVARCLGSDETTYFNTVPRINDEPEYSRGLLRAEIRHNLQQAGLLRGDKGKK